MGLGNLARTGQEEETGEAILAVFQDVGQLLEQARQEKNLTIKQAADQIHIRQQYLMALEAGHLSDLPGRVYILGFIRTYARFLALDGEELVRRISALPTLPDYERTQVPLPMPAEEGPSMRILMISAALVVAIGVGGYLLLKPASKAPLPTQDAPLEESSSPSVETSLLPSVSVDPEKAKDYSTSATPETTTETPAPPESLLTGERSPDKQDLEKPISSAPSGGKTVLRAKDPAWVEIRDENGRVLFMKVLQRGETYTVPDRPGVVLNTGNAGGLEIFKDDQKLPSLGERGAVKRGVRLDALQP